MYNIHKKTYPNVCWWKVEPLKIKMIKSEKSD